MRVLPEHSVETRPGDGWADLLFNFVTVDVLRSIRAKLQSADILIDLPWNGQRGPHANSGSEAVDSLLATVWADDLAFTFSHQEADTMIEKFEYATRTVIDELNHRGLQLNFGPGKTAGMINLRGRGSVARRRALFHHQQSQILVATQAQGTVCLRVVPHYKHFGVLHSSGNLGPDHCHSKSGIRQAPRDRVPAAQAEPEAPFQHLSQLCFDGGVFWSWRLDPHFRQGMEGLCAWNPRIMPTSHCG